MWYDDTGKIVMAGGKEQKRNVACPAPCRTPAGCPKGTPENPKTLTPENEQALQHYREATACGFTDEERDDPLVRRNAGIIKYVTDEVERERQMKLQLAASVRG